MKIQDVSNQVTATVTGCEKCEESVRIILTATHCATSRFQTNREECEGNLAPKKHPIKKTIYHIIKYLYSLTPHGLTLRLKRKYINKKSVRGSLTPLTAYYLINKKEV